MAAVARCTRRGKRAGAALSGRAGAILAALAGGCLAPPLAGTEQAAVAPTVAPPPLMPPVALASGQAPPAPPHEAERIDLAVPGHGPAVAWIPAGSARRPLVVASHGAGGTPEAQCELWRAIVAERAFVLCPRGVTMDVYAPPEARTWFYPNHPALGREVQAALAALEARFPDRLDVADAVYAGFSQGATMGALFFGPKPAPFARLVLAEGGADAWTIDRARAFHDHGGQRVLFVCGRQSCADEARRSVGYLTRAGVDARLVDRTGAGHTMGGVVREGVAGALPFIVGDDPRWGP